MGNINSHFIWFSLFSVFKGSIYVAWNNVMIYKSLTTTFLHILRDSKLWHSLDTMYICYDQKYFNYISRAALRFSGPWAKHNLVPYQCKFIVKVSTKGNKSFTFRIWGVIISLRKRLLQHQVSTLLQHA